MGFLQGLIASVFKVLLDFFWGRITDYLKKREAQKQAEKEIEEENKKIREKLEQAETPEEREDAAKDVFDRIDR
jgi:hypothetical protein